MTQQPTTLSPGLQALITLKQTANPMTQGAGGQPMPTIAGAELQKAQAAMQPQAPQMQQGIAGALGQAQAAAPSVEQNAQNAQAQQMAQKVAQLMQQQQQPQQMARGGVAGLPANNMRGFKEGGIIGFAEGKEVPNVGTPTLGAMPADVAAATKRFGSMLYDSPEVRADKIAKTKVLDALEKEPKADIPNRYTDDAKNAAFSDAKFNRPMGAGLGGFNVASTPTVDTGIVPPKPRPPMPRPAGAAGAAGAPAASGDVYSRFLDMVKPAPPSDAITKLEKEILKGDELRKAQSPGNETALTALQRAVQEREEEYQRMNASSNSRGLSELLRGLGTSVGGQGGEAMRNFEQSENARRAAYTDMKVLNAEKINAIEEVRRAKAAGDQDRLVAGLEKLAVVRNEEEKTRTQGIGNALQTGASAANNATQIQVANIQAAVQREHNELLKAQQGTKEQMLAAKIEAEVNKDEMLQAMGKLGMDDKKRAEYIRYKNQLIADAYRRQAPPEMYKKMLESGAFAASESGAKPPTNPKEAKLLSDYGLK
jgi:hypothetical protein